VQILAIHQKSIEGIGPLAIELPVNTKVNQSNPSKTFE